MKLAALALAALLASCGVVRWLVEPLDPLPEDVVSCSCEPLAAAPERAPARSRRPETRGGNAIDVVVGVGGALAGAPIAWGLFGQVAHVILGTASQRLRRRRNPTRTEP